MLPEMTDDAFLRLAMEEDNCEIAAGSVRGVLPRREPQVGAAPAPVIKFAFGSLINFQRRRREWTIEQLARQAQIDLDEAVSIEGDPNYRAAPRSVYQLAKVLALPRKELLALSGNAELSSEKLESAAVRFAARSRAVERLTDAEAAALNEFVAALAEGAGGRKD